MKKEINGFEIDKYNVHGFDLSNKEEGKTTSICVFCSKDRKPQNQKQKCVEIDLNIGWFTCQHCGESGQLHTFKKKKIDSKRKVFKKPEWKNITNLSESVVKWFENERKISQNTLKNARVGSGIKKMPPEWNKSKVICFTYFRFNELINIKYRSRSKDFMLYTGAELILYGYDNIIQSTECIIVEGEIDQLTWLDARYNYCVSVPNGATLKRINTEYLDSAIEDGIFENKEKIYIGTDNDEAGIILRDELVRRLGAERCYKLDFGDYKDSNALYVDSCNKYGKEKAREILLEVKNNAKTFPIQGVIELSDVESDLDVLYEEGLKKGLSLPFEDLSITVDLGRILTITGIPGHGKTAGVHQILSYFSTVYDYKAGIFTPESYPPKLFFSLAIEIICGCKFNSKYLKKQDYIQAKDFIKSYYKFIYPESFYLDDILESARQLVYRVGIKILVIDAYNNVLHKMQKFERDDLYVERFYIKLHEFAKRYNILIILVAHPVKIERRKDGSFNIPTAYDIKGGSAHYEKNDFIMCFYRNYKEKLTDVIVQKIKFRHLGEVCSKSYKFNGYNSRFYLSTMDKDNSNWIKNPPILESENMEFDGHLINNNDGDIFDRMEGDEAPF